MRNAGHLGQSHPRGGNRILILGPGTNWLLSKGQKQLFLYFLADSLSLRLVLIRVSTSEDPQPRAPMA